MWMWMFLSFLINQYFAFYGEDYINFQIRFFVFDLVDIFVGLANQIFQIVPICSQITYIFLQRKISFSDRGKFVTLDLMVTFSSILLLFLVA